MTTVGQFVIIAANYKDKAAECGDARPECQSRVIRSCGRFAKSAENCCISLILTSIIINFSTFKLVPYPVRIELFRALYTSPAGRSLHFTRWQIFTLHPLADLYTSPAGRSLYFIRWQIFILHPLADIYISPAGRSLYFIRWQIFILHPLADIYTSPPGRYLHFTRWQIFTLHPLADLYTSPAGRSLHFTRWQIFSLQRQLNFSGKNLASLQLPREDYLFTYPPLSRVSSQVLIHRTYSLVNWGNVE